MGALSCNDKKSNSGTTYYFENKSSLNVHTPILKMALNGKMQNWIIDTGANMSLIDESFYNNNTDDFEYLTEVDMTLNGVSGSKDYKAHYVLGELGTDFKLKHQFLTSDLTGVINNMKSRLGVDIVGIIGADYLDKYGFTVDYFNKAVYRHTIPLDSLMNINNTTYN